MIYLGDFAEDATVYIPFNTFSSDDPQASVTITNLADADLKVHKDAGLTQIATDGATITINFDGITGNHIATIDTSAHADYSIGSDYMVRIEGTTVDGATINAWIGSFSIENRFKEVAVVTWNGVALGTTNPLPNAAADAAGGLPISDAGGLDIDTKLANTNEITVARMGALTDWINGGRLDVLLDAIPTTAMRGTDGALTDKAGFSLSTAGILAVWHQALTAVVTAGSVGKLLKDEMTSARMAVLTDWINGGRLDLLLDAIPTTAMRGTDNAATAADLLDKLGAVSEAAAAGDPSATESVMQYVKQIVNVLVGTAGVTTFPAEAAPANAVSIAEVIRAIHADVTGLAGSAMRGTDSANTVVPDAAGVAPTAIEIRQEMDSNSVDLNTLITQIGTAGAGLTDLGGMSTTMKGQVNAEADTALNTAIPGAPTADSINERVATLNDDWDNAGRLDAILDSVLAMLDSARGEPAQGAPPVNPDAMTKLDWIYKSWRNLKDNDGSTTQLYNDAGTVVDSKQTTSEAGGTVSKAEWVSGP